MQSWADAYSAYGDVDRRSDLNHLIDLAKYTAEAWPDKEQGDGARINLGQIYLGMGQYDKAIEILSSVRKRSRDWARRRTAWGARTGPRAATWNGEATPRRPRRKARRRSTS